MPFIVRLLVNAAALWVATAIVPGVTSSGGPLPLLGVALVFGVQVAIGAAIGLLVGASEPSRGPVPTD